MTQNYDAFRQYEEQQRQQRATEKLLRSEQQLAAQQQAQALQLTREQERRSAEQRLAEQRLQAQQEAKERREREEQKRKSENARRKETLRLADQQRYVALLEAKERAKQRIVHEKRVWIGQDGYVYRSPAELEFYEEWVKDATRAQSIPLERQYKLGRYYTDFADSLSKTAIEIDGWGYHGKSQSDFEYGYERAQDIEEQGWDIKRLTAKQVYSDVQICVMRVYRYIERRRGIAR